MRLTFFRQNDLRHLQPNLFTRSEGRGPEDVEVKGGGGIAEGVLYAEAGQAETGGD